MRWFGAALAVAALAGCGREPNLRRHVPEVPVKKVAIGAAAAAAAATLANPDASGRPEGLGEPQERKVADTEEMVPAAVLDRLDCDRTREARDRAAPARRCEPRAPAVDPAAAEPAPPWLRGGE